MLFFKKKSNENDGNKSDANNGNNSKVAGSGADAAPRAAEADLSEVTFPSNPFRIRVQESWGVFLKNEHVVRELMAGGAQGSVIMEELEKLLKPAFSTAFAEIGKNGDKYDLILALEGDWSRLFPYVYFKKRAPKEVFEHWNIVVGRQSNGQALMNFAIRMGDAEVSAEDIDLWTEWQNGTVSLTVYCEALMPLVKHNTSQAYSLLYILLDQAVGELAEMKYISNISFADGPKGEKPLKLGDLMQEFTGNLNLSPEELRDAKRYIDLYSAYSIQPDEKATDGLRKDVFGGSTCLMAALNDFLGGTAYVTDAYEKDGIFTGYLYYPLDFAQGNDRSSKILDFRDDLVVKLEEKCGKDAFEFIGGATGVYYGYLDFIAYDLKAVLEAVPEAVSELPAGSEIEWVSYHSFRKESKATVVYRK